MLRLVCITGNPTGEAPIRQSASEISRRDRWSPERKSLNVRKFPSKTIVLLISVTSDGNPFVAAAFGVVPGGGGGGAGAAARAVTETIRLPDFVHTLDRPRRKLDCSSLVIGSDAIRGSFGSPRIASSLSRYCLWSTAVERISS